MQARRLIKTLQISIFSAVAAILTFFEVPMFFVPSFYKLDFSDVIVLISGFSMGPLAGVLTGLLKIVLKLFLKGITTAGIGDFANFLAGTALMLPSAIFYKKHRTLKGACLAMLTGIICMTIVSATVNYFILLPLYERLFSLSENTIISFGHAINPLIIDKFTFILLAVCPFNLIKGILVCAVTFLLYKKLSAEINNLFNKFVK